MTTSTPTRERILDAAISLFAQQGFKATSVAQIEAAAGLTPGAGGVFHHFRSKRALLEEGMGRHLARVQALRDIRRVVGDVGDARTQLTILARYVLAELDAESDLMRLLAAEARHHPDVLGEAVDQLITSGFTDFAGWLETQPESELDATQATAVASMALGALISSRLTRALLGFDVLPVDDETLVTTWVHGVVQQMTDPAPPPGRKPR